MDLEVKRLVTEVVDDLAKLEVVLFFHAHPNFIDSAARIARRMGSEESKVDAALQALSEAGFVERFVLGEGRYVLYAYSQSPRVRRLVERLSRAYHEDPGQRQEMVRMLLKL
jgi:predicted transcriptional regulator